MRGWMTATIFGLAGLAGAVALYAQAPSNDVEALRQAKARASALERRAEALRQEAASADEAVDRLVAQRAALGAEIDAANARIDAARARIAIIAVEQRTQAAQLGEASEPMLRLNALLQKLTAQPSAVMLVQRGDRRDYVHLRAVMASVEPAIALRTSNLRQQMVLKRELRAQEAVAIGSLREAQSGLKERRAALASLENENRNRASSLTAEAALEYERAIGQGERARDLVERIDADRESSQNAAELAALDGPAPRSGAGKINPKANPAFILPARGQLLSGFGELNPTGYRERGMRLLVAPGAPVIAPAPGKVTFAGRYRSFGNILIIDHGGGWTSLITGIEELGAEKGEDIAQGEQIGRASRIDPEIMVELRRHGRVIDIAALVY